MAITSNNFKVDKYGNMTANNGKFVGGEIELEGGTKEKPTFSVQSANSNTKTIINSDNIYITTNDGGLFINNTNPSMSTMAYLYNDTDPQLYLCGNTVGNMTRVKSSGITTPTLTQTSLEKIKKNIKKSNKNAIDIIKNSEIYEYNLKTEEDTDKKHTGFVIGNKYKTPSEVISKSGDGIDTYSMTSLLWLALKQEIVNKDKKITDLEERLKKLEKGEN